MAQRIFAAGFVAAVLCIAGALGVAGARWFNSAAAEATRADWIRSCVTQAIGRNMPRDAALAWCRDMREWYEARQAERWR